MGRLLSPAYAAPFLLLLTIPGSGSPPEARPAASGSQSRRLTFEQRVEAQRAIERIYYAHQIGTSRPFDEAVPRAVLEDKVRASLKQSEALRDLWSTPITGEALRREVERIAARTRFPDRVREIYAALGEDAFLVQETLGRATLVARLTRNFYARDERIHEATRREAETLRNDLARGKPESTARDRQRTVVEVRRAVDGGGHHQPSEIGPPASDDEPVRMDMESGEFDRWRARLPGTIGAVGPVVENRDGFTVSVLLAEGPGWVRASTWSIPKRPWESFWREVADRYDESKVEVVASPAATLPGAATAAPDCVTEDTWADTTTGDAPMARGGHTAVWTGSQMIVWGGAFGISSFVNTGGRYDPVTDTWLPTSTVNAPTRRNGHTAIWTGNRMVVWGGNGDVPVWPTGGRYDPIADEWTPTSTVGAPPARSEHSAVWTGSQMIVWGGDYLYPLSTGTGGRYDPVQDTWTTVSLTGAPSARSRHQAVWTGGTMVVWGGYYPNAALNTGGRYDPASDTWAPTSLLGAPQARTSFVSAWTGSEMVVWGGLSDGTGGVGLNTGGRYDPVLDLWRPTKLDATTPPALYGGTAVWSGTEMIVWGGICPCQGRAGGRYDPVADTWSAVSSAGAPSYRSGHSAVWTGGQMIVWGGVTDGTGGRYDPASNTWTPTSAEYVPAPASGHSALWTGNLMLVWGGSINSSFTPRNGRYDPTLDIWTGISTAGPSDARPGHSAVWTGHEMIVWGGNINSHYADGGRYSPLTDSWILISGQACDYRVIYNHTAVWTGQRMIVWGGRGYRTDGFSTTFGDGCALDVEEGTSYLRWTRLAFSNAPSARYGHSAVWTGTRMAIWGASSDSSGGLYDPVANEWTPTSLADAPSPRKGQAVVWTGNEMIVWGGQSSVPPQTYPVLGGRYDPSTDTWKVLPAEASPPGRQNPSAVWTGKEMIVWGGDRVSGPASLESSGGRYSPASDAWLPVSTVATPAARTGHTAIWTGRFMIVWGGATSTTGSYPMTNTGGLYAIGDSSDYDGDGLTVCGGDCDDTDPLTHPGAAEICDGKDSDCDGALPPDEADSDGDLRADCSDCSPADASVFAVPGIVGNVRTINTIPVQWQWDSLTSSAGTGTAYDVFYGSLSALRGSGGNFATGSCLSSPQYYTRVAVDPMPAEGDGFYIMVRGRNACGVGSYGSLARDTGASLSPAACP